MLQSKEKPIGRYVNEDGQPIKPVVKSPAKPAITNKPTAKRSRAENLDILKKLTAKSNEIFKLSGDTSLIIHAADFEKLPDAKLDKMVEDLIKTKPAFLK